MKFSILVPVYNVEKYLEQCVESLLAQTYDDYEIILVDDGSTDSSGKICDTYARRCFGKVKVIHKENGGHTSARLEAIKNATGEFCLFCDSDDFAENNLLETVNSALNCEKDADMIMYSFAYFKENKIVQRKQTISDDNAVYLGKNKKELYEFLISTPLINSLWTKAVKTEILKSDPTDYSRYINKTMAEDTFVSVYLITAAEKIVYINKPLYNYRVSDESISRSYIPKTIPGKNTLYVYDRFLKYLPKWGMDDEEHRQKLSARWLSETMYTFSQYYENARNSSERKAVLNYDWSLMLPKETCVNPNRFENKIYRDLFEWIKEKRSFRIRMFFFKKRFVKKIRILKARLLKK